MQLVNDSVLQVTLVTFSSFQVSVGISFLWCNW